MAAEHDLELVERIRQGDKAALASYVEEHRASLTAYIGRRLSDMLRSKVEADDLVQETAAAALRSLPQADLSQREPFGWLCHLADERIVDAYRHHVRAQKR